MQPSTGAETEQVEVVGIERVQSSGLSGRRAIGHVQQPTDGHCHGIGIAGARHAGRLRRCQTEGGERGVSTGMGDGQRTGAYVVKFDVLVTGGGHGLEVAREPRVRAGPQDRPDLRCVGHGRTPTALPMRRQRQVALARLARDVRSRPGGGSGHLRRTRILSGSAQIPGRLGRCSPLRLCATYD